MFKKIRVFLVIFLLVVSGQLLIACKKDNTYTINANQEYSRVLNVGDSDVDYTKYFTITDQDNNVISVTLEMLDLSKVDTTKAGTFDITISYEDKTLVLTFTVEEKTTEKLYTITYNQEYSRVLNVGDSDIDYTKYFTITDQDNNVVTVTQDMLDLSNVDTTKVGTFDVTISYSNKSLVLTFTVEDKSTVIAPTNIEFGSYSSTLNVGRSLTLSLVFTPQDASKDVVWASSDTTVATVTNSGVVTALKAGTATISATSRVASTVSVSAVIEVIETSTDIVDLSTVFNKYDQYEEWNFVADYKVSIDNELAWNYFYYFDGLSFRMDYDYENDIYSDYVIYKEQEELFYYFYDDGFGGFEVYQEGSFDFEDAYQYVDILELTELNQLQFVLSGDHYEAVNPQAAGELILGAYEGDTWSYVYLYVENETITRIVGESSFVDSETNEAHKYLYDISLNSYGTVSINPDEFETSTDTPVEGNVSTFLDSTLTVATGQLTYSTTSVAQGYDEIRGVQFLQANGTVTITSDLSATDVTTVTLVVATNQESGMKVKVKVGSVEFLSEGNATADVAKTNFDVTTTLQFTNATAVSGVITIELIPNATKKSMYIVSVALNGGGTVPPTTEVMPSQTYDDATADKKNLQDALADYDGGIGLPSTGDYACLVVPVQFSDTTISAADLEKLQKALNGTRADTGWESVSSFYTKSSNGLLNLSFDIQSVYQSTQSSTYYKNYEKEVDFGDGYYGYQTGDELLLLEVLAYLEPLIDLTKYDTNNDGIIDAVYLIYSAEVEYESDDDFYWAYVTQYVAPEAENQTFDGLDAYYYLFAGFDFLDEDTENGFEYSGKIPGLQINASTFIHETGHLLGLDDYYDYDTSAGCNEGLGGADMMDWTVGDHNAYSKLMLGWISPTVITTDSTFDLGVFGVTGQTIMVLLDYDGTYFSEYLLIDLYAATGLNEMHASLTTSYLFGGAEYGVRIYHVSSDISLPYNDEYASFTTYNNTLTNIPLIKLVEADGESKFASTRGEAAESDLWQTGDVFSTIQQGYTRNDGKLVNFDIVFNAVTATNANVTITFTTD